MGDKEIYQWLHQAREAGLSDMKIIDKLKNQGWSNDQIDKILVGAYSDSFSIPTPSKINKIFSPAEKFKIGKTSKKNPLDKLKDYKYSGIVGQGSFGKLWLLIKNYFIQFVFLYLMLMVCLAGIIFTPESMTLISFILIILTALIFFLALIMITKNKWSITEATKDMFPMIFKYIYTMFLAFFVMIGGFILLIIPGVIMSISFTMLPYVIINENKFGFSALKRTYQLTKGYKGKIFLYSILFNIFINIAFGILIISLLILVSVITNEAGEIMSDIASFGTFLIISLLGAFSIIAFFAFFKSFYDDLSYLLPSNDAITNEDTSKNNKTIIISLFIIGMLSNIFFGYYFFKGINPISLYEMNIGSSDLVDDNIELVKLPFTYKPPAAFDNDFNRKYKNGYSSTYSYNVPNTTDHININIYLEENDNNLSANDYIELDESILKSIYDTSTILFEGEINIDNTAGYYIEKTYEFFNSKKYSNKVVYIKKDYIVEITLECASRYYLDYKTLFNNSLTSFRLK